jgi:hypothetical protein
VSKDFLLCNAQLRAPSLVVEFGIAAGGVCVPDGDIVAT